MAIPKSLKICCAITTILIITLLVTMVILFLTILKPKHPKVTALPVNEVNYSLLLVPYTQLNLSFKLVVSVQNPNYGSFMYHESTTNVTYHETLVAEAHVPSDTFPARATRNISSSIEVQADKFSLNSNFSTEYSAGSLNLASSSVLHGKVVVFKVLKIKATSYTNCYITIFVTNFTANSKCKSRVAL